MTDVPEPMSMSDFAKYIGKPEDEIFELSFQAFCDLLAEHGFHITGDGILPRPVK